MCLPSDVIPSLLCAGKARGVNVSQWAVDQRPFVWAEPSKRADKLKGALWPSWPDTPFYQGAPLPYAGIQVKAGGSDNPLEADSSSLGNTLRASITTPLPKELLQPKVWEPRSDGREAGPAVKPFFSPPSCAASGVETLQQSLSREGSVVSCTSSPRISMRAVEQEKSESTEVPTKPIDAWESSRSKEERCRRSSWVEQLLVEDRMQNAVALKRKLSSSIPSRGKTSRIIHHKSARNCNNNRPAPPKKDITTSSRDLSRSDGGSENENPSDDKEEGGPAVSEKRRKRMMSNRASAQRSRQRRQERLDTLEALVAELRVENAALTRTANNAATAAKKFEEEIKILRDRLGKQEPDSNASNESDKTTENSDMAVDNRNGTLWRASAAVEPRRNGSSSDNNEETRHHDRPQESSRPPKLDGDYIKPGGNSKRWTNNISSSSFDFEFGSEPMENGVAADRGALRRTTALPENSGGGVNVKDVYQSAMMSLAQTQSFQSLDPFGIDLEHYNQEMDKKSLDTRSEDDMWLESLANCLK